MEQNRKWTEARPQPVDLASFAYAIGYMHGIMDAMHVYDSTKYTDLRVYIQAAERVREASKIDDFKGCLQNMIQCIEKMIPNVEMATEKELLLGARVILSHNMTRFEAITEL